MSDTQQGPEWWQASDGKWYPPPRPDWPEPAVDDTGAVDDTAASVPTDSTDAAATEADQPPAAEHPPAEHPPADPAPVAPPPVAPPPTEPPPAGSPPAAPAGPPSTPPTEVGPIASSPTAPPSGGPPLLPPPGAPPAAPLPGDSTVFGPPGTGASVTGDPFGTPEKNKTPLIVGGVIAAVIALVIGFLVFGGGDDDDSVVASDTTETTEDGPSNKEGESDPDPDPPPDDDFPEFVDPADADPVEVDESGFVIVPDEFDEGVINASYGFSVTNPNAGLAATSVEVSIGLFDEAGTAVETESQFISGLLGGQTVGMGGFVRDVPDGIVRIEVTAEASQLVRADELGGELTVSDITVAEEEFGGITVTFVVSSTFPERQENLTLYGVFRNDAGEPIGGTQSFLEFVEGNGSSNAELRSFADVPGIDTVDVSVTLSAGNFFD